MSFLISIIFFNYFNYFANVASIYLYSYSYFDSIYFLGNFYNYILNNKILIKETSFYKMWVKIILLALHFPKFINIDLIHFFNLIINSIFSPLSNLNS